MFHPLISPDRTRIVFSDFGVFIVDADGDNLETVLSSFGELNRATAWSPDGSSVYFHSNRGDPSRTDLEIYRMGVDGSASPDWTVHPALDYDAVASPDGTRIAFVSERDGNPEIYVMDADGTDIMRLTDHVASDLEPIWSHDGTRIAFSSDRTGNFEIYTINADGSGVPTI